MDARALPRLATARVLRDDRARGLVRGHLHDGRLEALGGEVLLRDIRRHADFARDVGRCAPLRDIDAHGRSAGGLLTRGRSLGDDRSDRLVGGHRHALDREAGSYEPVAGIALRDSDGVRHGHRGRGRSDCQHHERALAGLAAAGGLLSDDGAGRPRAHAPDDLRLEAILLQARDRGGGGLPHHRSDGRLLVSREIPDRQPGENEEKDARDDPRPPGATLVDGRLLHAVVLAYDRAVAEHADPLLLVHGARNGAGVRGQYDHRLPDGPAHRRWYERRVGRLRIAGAGRRGSLGRNSLIGHGGEVPSWAESQSSRER